MHNRLVMIALLFGLGPSFSPSPALTLKERRQHHSEWVQQVFEQHHKFTVLKLFYTRLPKNMQVHHNKSLEKIHHLYQRVTVTLEELKKEKTQNTQVLIQLLKRTCQQISKEQTLLLTDLQLLRHSSMLREKNSS